MNATKLKFSTHSPMVHKSISYFKNWPKTSGVKLAKFSFKSTIISKIFETNLTNFY